MFTAVVLDAAAKAKARLCIQNLKKGIAAQLVGLKDALLETSLADPTMIPPPEIEYAQLMIGADNSDGVDLIELAGNRSADPDNRIRFNKEDWLFIADAARSPRNFSINNSLLRVRLGSLTWHLSQSYFSYTNIEPGNNEHDEDAPPGATYEVGPYFGFFLVGGTFSVAPRFKTNRPYPLRPDVDHPLETMQKTITKFNMYDAVRLRAARNEFMSTVLAPLGPGSPT